MSNIGQSFVEDFEIFRKDNEEKGISCEMVDGHVVRSQMTKDEGRKLCFLLGTLLQDYMLLGKREDKVIFGPAHLRLNDSNLFMPDIMTVSRLAEGENEKINQKPKMVIEILAAGSEIYDCLDKAVLYQKFGIKEYWLIDLKEQFVYTYIFRQKFDYKRYHFEQNIRSQCYPGFECCISDILWEENNGLKELALFYRFKQDVYPDRKIQFVAEDDLYDYSTIDEMQYTADAFYEWMATRKNLSEYTSMVELLFGNLRETTMPAFRHQNIRGDLYFAIKSFLKQNNSPYQLCFMPTLVELKKVDLLDSVVSPDLFLIHKEEIISDNIYRGVPEWVIEVVSPTTAAQDYIDKAQLYQYHGVKEYWIVNDWKRQVMVLIYKDDVNEEDNVETFIYEFYDKISVQALPGLDIIMDEVCES